MLPEQRKAHERLREALKDRITTHQRYVEPTSRERTYYAGYKTAEESGRRGRQRSTLRR